MPDTIPEVARRSSKVRSPARSPGTAMSPQARAGRCGPTPGATCGATRCSGSRRLIVLFVVMAAFPQLFTDKDPLPRRPRQGPAAAQPEALVRLRRAGLRRLRPHRLRRPRLDPGRASAPPSVTLVVRLGCGDLAGFFGGWVDAVLSRIADIFFGIPVVLGGILVLSFPSDLDDAYIVVVVKVVIVLAPRLAADRPLMRSSVLAGQAERLRPGRARARRLRCRIIPSHILPELARPGHRRLHHQSRHLHLRRGHPVVPGRRAAAAGHLLGHRSPQASASA